MEYGLNVGGISKGYQAGQGMANQGHDSANNAPSGGQGSGGGHHKNIMSHRVSYDQYGTPGGILAGDMGGQGSSNLHNGSGTHIPNTGGRYGHISMSGGALGSGPGGGQHRNHQSSSYAGRLTG